VEDKEAVQMMKDNGYPDFVFPFEGYGNWIPLMIQLENGIASQDKRELVGIQVDKSLDTDKMKLISGIRDSWDRNFTV